MSVLYQFIILKMTEHYLSSHTKLNTDFTLLISLPICRHLIWSQIHETSCSQYAVSGVILLKENAPQYLQYQHQCAADMMLISQGKQKTCKETNNSIVAQKLHVAMQNIWHWKIYNNYQRDKIPVGKIMSPSSGILMSLMKIFWNLY